MRRVRSATYRERKRKEERAHLILARVPVNMQVPLLPHRSQRRVKSEDDLLVRPTLEGNTLALVVEAETEVERDGDALAVQTARSAGFDDASDERFGIEGWSLAV